MNKFCTYCGKKIPDGSSFCNSCGKSIINNTLVNKNNNSDNEKGIKIASLIIGIISIVLSFLLNFLIIPLAIVGLVLGIIYSKKTKKFCAGIVLNIIGIIIPIVIVLLLVNVYNNITESIKNMLEDTNYQESYNDSNDNYSSNNEEFNNNDNNFSDDEYGGAIYNGSIVGDVSGGIGIVDGNGDITEESNNSESIEIDYFKETNLDDLVNMINNKEDFILVVSQTYCGHCINYKPKIEQVANEKKVLIYYIEYNLLSDDEKTIFNNYINITGTPTTVFFKDGYEVLDARLFGNTDTINIENSLRNNGYIN
jgi:predicted bacteriocin transport accessory protein